MTAYGLTLFETKIGRCGIAWSERGIAAVRLPDKSHAVTRAGLTRHCPGAKEQTPPPAVQQVIDGIAALLSGEARDFASVRLDMEGVPEFHRRVYEIARTIGPGAMLSYGEIATRLGEPGAARDVGQALGRNPFPIIVPCHRVVAAGGKLGGFSAPGGNATKRRLLAIEGAHATSLPLFR
jgi:methylated-DNA-[protein]-cysteine S-methyltransferase